MVAMYNELSGDSDYPRFREGNRRWFPVFQSSSTDFFGVCCGNGEVMHDDNELGTGVEFVSLEAMLRTLLRGYGTDVYFVNDQGRLRVNRAAFKELARHLDPGLKRWQ